MATSGAVFFDRGSERTTAPCEFAKLHSAMLVALQQRRVHPLKHTLQPMRYVRAFFMGNMQSLNSGGHLKPGDGSEAKWAVDLGSG